MRSRSLIRELDYSIPIITLALVIIGLLMVASATQTNGFTNNPFVIRQLIALILGVIFLILSLGFDYRVLKEYSEVIYLLNIILLVVVIIFGIEFSGTRRWVRLGPINLQPAELVKLGLIICLADFFAKHKKELVKIKQCFISCLYIMPILILGLAQNDLGTNLVFIFIFAGMFYAAGANLKYYFTVVITAVLGIGGMLFAHFQLGMSIPLKEYQLMRLIVFWDPTIDPLGYGYNIIQSKIAVGSGGLLGKGLFQGTQTNLGFLPEKHTDFIFSVLGEELGFLGAVVVLVLFFLLLWRIFKVALEAEDDFGQLLTIGILVMLLFHVFENVGMAIGIMPITGIPLPFISYGGSSLLTNILAIGLVVNVNVRRKKLKF
ncbi:rod shape-determining protein RodA [Fuchsiella alkaliacetigena]|uniref:rod shape-determining protein RodA n=1 Tax=Fuchsiella alkaliacetigena TaxID=957042 RepID=UPI00200A82BB|nr:rod shape-determining protein RodA [Fuchsiella alkaliacetigena]MCK8825606.1 rod shape-determining protein RodA [Fuchsiella alkaliacetigena]